MNSLSKTLVAGAVCAASIMTTQGAVVVGWSGAPNGAGDLGTAEESPSVTTVGVSRGSGLVYNASGGTYNSRDWEDGSDSATADAAGDYLAWSFTVEPDFELEPTTLDLGYDRSGTGPTNIELLYSLDGFGTAGTSIFTDSSISTTANSAPGIDLTGLGTLSAGATVSFRLVGWGASGSSGTFDLQNEVGLSDDRAVIINATITPLNASAAAAPEPGTAGMLLAGCAIVGMLRSKKEEA